MKIHCNACGHELEAPAGSVEVRCPACGARITLTAMETRPGALARADGPDPEELIGEILGGYRLTAILGGGGMGTVYEATRTEDASSDGPEVAAVKVLSSVFTHDEAFVERFRREADSLTQLRHPNLIEVYARGEHGADDQRRYFFVMERFFGEDLRSLMARGSVAPATAVAVIRLAAEGLSYAHAHGIVHRDVKPANILVSGDPAAEGKVKVVDFGVAQLASANYTLTSLTSSSLVLGTINYMSPEQRIDASEIDHRADVYALGVVAYELLTGRLPIGAFEPPSELAGTARAADRAVLSALRPDPKHRPASVIAFATSLESALARRGIPRFAGAAAMVVLGLAAGATLIDDFFPGEIPPPKRPVVVKETPQVQKVQPEQQAQAPEPPPYTPTEAIRGLAARMRRDAEYALARSAEAPAKKQRRKRQAKARKLLEKERSKKNALGSLKRSPLQKTAPSSE